MLLRPFLCLAFCLAVGCAPQRPPPVTVAAVDLPRYMGTWYEISRYDHWFERDLVAVTATYALLPDSRISVVNQGHKTTLDGPVQTATATAWAVAPAQLKVRFFWPFAGDYWIIGLDPSYHWAVVGTPKRDFLWFLHREPDPPAADVAVMRAVATTAGFDLTPLQPVPQPSRLAK
jgi:apolipoprotein D and lipocalin family protein